MSIASEILRIQQAKQAIKDSINNKGGTLTNESIDDYAQAIDNLPSGGGGMTYEDYARTLYLGWGKSNQFATAWAHSLTVDPLEISAGEYEGTGRQQYLNQEYNGENEGVIIPQGITSIGGGAFSNWSSNNQPLVIPNSVTSIGEQAFYQWSDNNQPLVIPNSVTSIGAGAFIGWSANNQPLTIPNSLTSIGDDTFTNWSANNHPLVIPDSVTSIGGNAFNMWGSNNQPLVIPNSVTSIGYYAFAMWTSNNQQLVIPNSVTSIGYYAFGEWYGNNQPLVIPDSVTSIDDMAFESWSLVPYVEMKSSTPPTLAGSGAFENQNDAPIYVPHNSVTAYKTATNWVTHASRIFSINDK